MDRDLLVGEVLEAIAEKLKEKPTPAMLEGFLKLLGHAGDSKRLSRLEAQVAQLSEELDAADKFLRSRLMSLEPMG